MAAVALCALAVPALAQMPTAAARFGLPLGSVERVEKRTASAKHFRRPDGSLVAIIGAGPVHYRDATGAWQDIDPTFHDDGAGGLISDHAPVQVAAKPNGQISVTRDGVGVRWLTPVNLAPRGGNAIGGTDAKGIQWRWTATGTALKLNGTVTAPQGPQTYRFPYQLLGVSDFTIDDRGNAVAGGAVVVPCAVIHGADGKDYPTSVWQTGPGPHLEFSFDDSSLPPAAYPHVIDPTTIFYSAITDGDIYGVGTSYSTARSTSYSYDAAVAAVGQWHASAYVVNRVYVEFDTSSIGAGSAITGVTLTFTVDTDYSDTDFTVRINDYNWSSPITTTNREANYDGCLSAGGVGCAVARAGRVDAQRAPHV